MLVLLGVMHGDTHEDMAYLLRKLPSLRIFEDEAGKMNLSLLDIKGEALVVSQFTLAADTKKGNRPSFAQAERPERARAMYEEFVEGLRSAGVPVQTGVFAAMMDVSLVNDGPVTIMVDSRA